MKSLIALGALAALFAPVAMAASLADTSMLTSALPSPADQVGAAFGQYYVADDGSIWMESNGIAGLQQHDGQNADGSAYHADTSIFAAPAAPGFPGTPELPQIPL